MSNHLPITDADRAWWRGLSKPDTASDIVSASLADVGATSDPAPTAPEPPAARPFGRREIAVIVAGLVVALAAIALLGRGGAQQRQPRAAPAMAPAATQARPTATIAPTAEPSPTAQPTATAEPPTPEPEVIYIEVAPPCDPAVNPLYSVALEVLDDKRRPLGQVVGVSCDSQAAAQANAEQAAQAMKEGR